jgi:fatty acid desaturase
MKATTDLISFEAEDRLTRDLVRDLNGVRPAIYWTDLIATALVGWAGFAAAVMLKPFSIGMMVATAVAVAGLYRGLCFIHEISHQSSRVLPGFETAWNLLIGYPLLLPSFVYVGVHPLHHKLSTYGTGLDPEYLPFARSCTMTVLFALESFLIPIALLVRFLVISPIGMVSRSFQNWLVVHASSLTMNVSYRREVTDELARRIVLHSAQVLLLWITLASLAIAGVIPWKALVVWFGVSACISFINTLRTLGAHTYESTGEPTDRAGQLADSIDTPGAPWTEIWAPVGLRYHALHHYFPGIPYHNLGEARRRLSATLPSHAQYHKVCSPGLAHSLLKLCHKGFQSQRHR